MSSNYPPATLAAEPAVVHRHEASGVPLFRKVLIANRGEIAVRVICACKDLGIRTVAVYSEADRDSLHVSFADEAVCIGPAKSSQSYLDFPRIISAAEIANVDAIHPGYGFLSENADFAEVCEMSQLKFIGPPPEVIRLMGNKDRARSAMKAAGVPVLPGSDGLLKTVEEALETADAIGYPVIIKASAGGGGRGMRIVRSAADLPGLYAQARHEADQAFSCPDVYLEKYIENPRHIEFQVICDSHGDARVLGERECSIQRRHQKLVEEAPSPAVDPELRADIASRLETAMRNLGYVNAGTVEFLMDAEGKLHFIEVNARIQVEHPVTEMITGIDLVTTQLLIACGAKLTDLLPDKIEIRGHAIECRINAEDPINFKPSPGRITAFHLPSGIGVRVDTHAYVEGVIPPHYDSLVAKLIVHGNTRQEAIARTLRALDMFVVEGIQTSIPLHKRIISHPEFQAGNLDTGFLVRTGVTS
ncbi:MAG: acetyl-CoA carboxylase biotin carboxylase subunit [Bryobacterales bacterium]|nr:acetyl-CoA carboxylase biotin carboxylase subunit [Bryobacterales bacterium]